MSFIYYSGMYPPPNVETPLGLENKGAQLLKKMGELTHQPLLCHHNVLLSVVQRYSIVYI